MLFKGSDIEVIAIDKLALGTVYIRMYANKLSYLKGSITVKTEEITKYKISYTVENNSRKRTSFDWVKRYGTDWGLRYKL